MSTETSAMPGSAKRGELMATAWKLFYRDGYRAVGIDTLLAEAGVAKKTLYHHFASKEALIIAVLQERSRRLLAGMDEAIAGAGRSPAKRMAAIFGELERWFESEEFKGCAFIRALSEYPEPEHPIHQAAWAHKRAVRARIAAIAVDAGVKAADAFANAVGFIFDGAIVTAHATGDAKTAETAKKAALELLAGAVGR